MFGFKPIGKYRDNLGVVASHEALDNIVCGVQQGMPNSLVGRLDFARP